WSADCWDGWPIEAQRSRRDRGRSKSCNGDRNEDHTNRAERDGRASDGRGGDREGSRASAGLPYGDARDESERRHGAAHEADGTAGRPVGVWWYAVVLHRRSESEGAGDPARLDGVTGLPERRDEPIPSTRRYCRR